MDIVIERFEWSGSIAFAKAIYQGFLHSRIHHDIYQNLPASDLCHPFMAYIWNEATAKVDVSMLTSITTDLMD